MEDQTQDQGQQIKVEYVIAAYKRRIADLEEQTIMMQAALAQQAAEATAPAEE